MQLVLTFDRDWCAKLHYVTMVTLGRGSPSCMFSDLALLTWRDLLNVDISRKSSCSGIWTSIFIYFLPCHLSIYHSINHFLCCHQLRTRVKGVVCKKKCVQNGNWTLDKKHLRIRGVARNGQKTWPNNEKGPLEIFIFDCRGASWPMGPGYQCPSSQGQQPMQFVEMAGKQWKSRCWHNPCPVK